MKKTAVIYWSGTGNTEAMANAVAEGMRRGRRGVQRPGRRPMSSADAVAALDAVALGCPAMGAEELEETEFAPMFDGIKSSARGQGCRAVRLLWLGRRRMDAHVGRGLRLCRHPAGG